MVENNLNASKSETQVPATSPAMEGTPATPTKSEAEKTAAKEQQEQQLAGLAKKICEGKCQLHDCLKKSSGIARGLGESLLQAKGLVKAGCWTAWLGDNCKLTSRQAQKYMRLAGNWQKLVANGTNPEELSIEENLALLAKPGSVGQKAKGPTSSSTKSSAAAANRFQVSSKQELKTKERDADDLLEEPTVFSPDTAVAQLVQDIIASVVEQVRKQVPHLKAKGDDTQEIDPVVLAIAVLKKVQKDLNPKAVAEIVEPATPTVEAPETEAKVILPQNRLNGAMPVSVAS